MIIRNPVHKPPVTENREGKKSLVWLTAVLSLLPSVKEVLDSVLHTLGLMHHAHWFVLQGSVSHAVVNVLVLLEHPQLHLCLHTHGL